jgi:hypothetical protein
VLHHAPAAQDDGLVGQLAHDGQIVADQDVGNPRLITDVSQQVQHLRLDRHIERRDRLVENQDPRFGGQRTGDTFAYYFIRRGERHGLRIVGSLKSQPALNLLAAYDK